MVMFSGLQCYLLLLLPLPLVLLLLYLLLLLLRHLLLQRNKKFQRM